MVTSITNVSLLASNVATTKSVLLMIQTRLVVGRALWVVLDLHMSISSLNNTLVLLSFRKDISKTTLTLVLATRNVS